MRKFFGSSSFARDSFYILLAVEVLMSFTFLGYFHFPPISITIAYLPVIIAACVFGTRQAVLTGIVFGLSSLYKASASYVMPLDMVFSPFNSSEPLASLFLSVGTRALFGLLIGLAFDAVRGCKRFRSWMCLLTLLSIRLHSFLVCGAMGILFPQFNVTYATSFKLDKYDFCAALVVLFIVPCVWELYNSARVQQLKTYIDHSGVDSYVQRSLRKRALSFFTVAVTMTLITAAYFSQRTAFMLDKHGVEISAHISGDLLHLQFMFVMAILALDFILMIVGLWAYKYLMYKEYLGSLDSLTGVMGRKMFLNKCVALQKNRALLKSKAKGWFLFFDVDAFKSINDTYGHLVGDEVLCGFAKRLDEALSPYGVVGRLGGDEFAAILHKPITQNALAALLDDLYKDLADILPQQKVTCSIGVCSFTYPQEIRKLMYATDKALYKAKERGRACYVFGEAENKE